MDKFKFTQEAKCEKSELDYGTQQVTNQINIFESYFKTCVHLSIRKAH